MEKITIKPELASGFRDYLPEEMIPRQEMMDKIRTVFECFGFAPLDTPVIEREELLTGGDPNFDKEIFRLASRKEERETSGLALRFDLTVSLARSVAANLNMRRPIKLYQIGNVFRAERAQKGRQKGFVQCDADIIGSDSPLSDAEIISLVYQTLSSLDIPEFKIKINDRRFLLKIMGESGVPSQKYNDVLRIVDKLDKIGWSGVEKELKQLVSGEEIKSIKKFIESDDKDNFAPFIELKKNLDSLGVPGDSWEIDASLVRGQSYYSGIIFETVLNDIPEVGSICGGGRYDGLISRFSKEELPAVGMSVGLDRLFTALEKLGKIEKRKATADVLVLNFDESCANQVQKTTGDLRSEGIKTELYLGKVDTFKGQLAYAVSREYPVVVIIGPKELEKNVAQIKDMKARTQSEVAISSVSSAVLELRRYK